MSFLQVRPLDQLRARHTSHRWVGFGGFALTAVFCMSLLRERLDIREDHEPRRWCIGSRQLGFVTASPPALRSLRAAAPRHASATATRESTKVDARLEKLQQLAADGAAAEAEDFVYEMIDAGLKVGTEHYSALIDACAPSADLDRAERWLFRMQQLKVQPDRSTYNALLKVAAEAKQVEFATSWLQEMQQAGIEADVHSFRLILHAVRQSGKIGQMEPTFEYYMGAGLQPDLGCLNEVIGAYADVQDVAKVDEWLAIAELNLGLSPDVGTYNAVLGGHAAVGDMESAERIVERIVEQGIRPDLTTYRLLIGDGLGSRDFQTVNRWSKELEKSGLEMDGPTFESVIGAWSGVGDAEAAENWFAKMVDENLQTASALAIVADALVLGGGGEGAESAQEWVDQCRASGMKLTPGVYASLASADIFAGDFEQVEARLQQMESDGLEMDEDALSALLLAYANAEPQQSELAEQMFKQQLLGGMMQATRKVLEALRAAVGGQRCLDLRRELSLAQEFEPGKFERTVGNKPLSRASTSKRRWKQFRTEEVEPELKWE